MDKESVIQLAQAVGWLIGGFGSIIIALLSVIAYFIKHGQDKIEVRVDKHDEEIKEIALQSRETLTILKHKFKIK